MTRHPCLSATFVLMLLGLLVTGSSSVASSAEHAQSPAAGHRLLTAIADPAAFSDPQASIALVRTRSAGASIAKIALSWDGVAPRGKVLPAAFDATDPADAAYRWDSFDALVKKTVRSDLQPLVVVANAPAWATRQPHGRSGLANWNVDPERLGEFMEAAARRFSGSFHGLPRIRYWQVWNEPNLSVFLNPQLSGQLTQEPSCPFSSARVVSADLYREMINASAEALHRVRADNLVVAGGMSPFCGTAGVVATAPLLFMRKLLCMSDDPTPRPTCNAKVEFDVFAAHPYTAGGPTKEALRPDDVSIGDLPEVNRLLRAAVRARHVVSRRRVQLWVTEFGWDSKPPDNYAVPLKLHARWVSEALYRMWLDGVTLITWYGLRDEAADGRGDAFTIQSGLYFRSATIAQDRPKPALEAFRFPFVAYKTTERKVRVWGRTPRGERGQVVVESFSGAGSKPIRRLRTDRFGIFRRTISAPTTAETLRARLPDGSRRSRPFSLTRPPDLKVNPFGGPYDEVP